MHRSLRFLVGVFLFVAFGLSAGRAVHGQGGATGAISGVVVDSSGSSVSDAEVQIIASATESWSARLTPERTAPSSLLCSRRAAILPWSTNPGSRKPEPRASKSTSRKPPASPSRSSPARFPKKSKSSPKSPTSKPPTPPPANPSAPKPSASCRSPRRIISSCSPFHPAAKRTQCLRATRPRQRPHHRQRPARRQQQLLDRRHRPNGLQRRPVH